MKKSYSCQLCTEKRKLIIEYDDLQQNLDTNKDGLFFVSDLHQCENGYLGVNNIYFNAKFDVQMIENLEIKYQKSRPLIAKSKNVPIPTGYEPDRYSQKILIYDHTNDFKLRFILKNAESGYLINLGNVKPKEEVIHLIQSDNYDVSLEIYESEINYRIELLHWLKIGIDFLESANINSLSILLEVIKFIQDIFRTRIDNYYLNMLKLILLSKDTILIPVESHKPSITDLNPIFGIDEGEIIFQILNVIHAIKNVSFYQLASFFKFEITYIVHLIIYLVDEQFIHIDFPQSQLQSSITTEYGISF
ncbi:MAG: hypothetical protein OEZ01_16280 [Candidatus Heimdallarchaeota archaeon]|nr:hypothetical protein [Candidatus Heimdallarchaeota archaeon]MDH5647569.1 hypothetical protein [Candidatus Heimdallarchaeota archaeon]